MSLQTPPSNSSSIYVPEWFVPATSSGGVVEVSQGELDDVSSEVATKAPLISPTFSGIPTAPTPAPGTDTTQLATTAFVRSEVASLVDSAPSSLDTLQELAASLNNDANFSTSVINALALKAPIANPSLTGLLRVQAISENIVNHGTTASSTISADYALGSTFYCTPESSSNLTLTLTNVPTTNTYCCYTVTIILDASSYRPYVTVLNLNGTGRTLVSHNGVANLSTHASSTAIIQTVNIIHSSSASVPFKCVTSLASLF